MATPHTLMVLLLAGIVAVSAKPRRAPSYEDRLYNRRGEWYDAIVDTASDVGDAIVDAKDVVVDAFDKRAVNPESVKDNIPEQMVPGLRFNLGSLPEDRLYNRRGFFDGWGDTFSDWGDAIADTASDVGDAIVDTASDVGDAIVDAKDVVVDAFDKRAVNPESVKDNIPEQMVPGLRFNLGSLPEDRLYNRRGEWYEGWGDTFSNWGDAIVDTASDVGDTLTSWGNTVGDAIVDAKDAVVDAFDKRAVEPVSIMDNIPEQMVPGLRYDLASLPEKRLYNRRGWIDGWGDSLGHALSDTASDVGDTLNSFGNSVGDAAVAAKDEIADAFDKRAVYPVAEQFM